ncbi:5'-nucleotidase, lipoprotein e(P4) family [Celerinatantimonas diazotrophica]|uniref:5'-nucleotidase (Lipoprotein e(P4) family) n=1 Tax=Celerinatantimonas diazotrophica TaxID=412034 RepID=A0A4R1KER9_9GAMM|nr:5'-nucleotidase, lipoprotein e(P4) family [Celerinatantimonas diazotrophica]TCK63198.1 5'-nucleotidase (lipoprotein e(P4) family) [Celerinatantimonas diazotrophica]CAG9295567.1 Lipoprotein E [Celerinatantimonas diazotrophica]
MLKQLSIIAFSSLILSGCAQLSPTDSQTQSAHPGASQTYSTKDLNEQQMQALVWMQRSAEYRALCYQAFNVATNQLKKELSSDHDKPLAVVVDIDETILNNSPYQAWLIGKNQGYSSKTWQQWVKQSKAKAIPGALSFLNFASENGVQVFYVTNRAEKVRQATLTNLKQLGFPDVVNSHLLMKTTSSNKGPRRDQIRAHYDVALYMGDNLGDFSHKFDGKSMQQRQQLADQYRPQWGTKYIVLPNPVYGTWDGAAIDYKWGASAATKNKLRKEALRVWHP